MNPINRSTRFMAWPMTALLLTLAAGCSTPGNGDPILGISGVAALAPTVLAVAPANQATAVTINSTIITASFSEPMAPISGGATFTVAVTASGAKAPGTVALNAAGSIATFTLTPGTTLAPLTPYTATVTGATSLATGLSLAAPYVWTFSTGSAPDTTRPRVTFTVPVTTTPGPTLGVPSNAAITALFSEAMAPATISDSSFTVTAASPGVNPAGTVSYSVAAKSATFTPATPGTLVVGTTYTATITSLAKDLAGNALAGNQAPLPAASDYAWSFTTTAPDATLPTLTLENPANLATGVAINGSVNATFSKAMSDASITLAVQQSGSPLGPILAGAFSYDALTHTASFVPSSNFLANTTYTATITGAKDVAGNALAIGLLPNPWTFTTALGGAPAPGALALNTAASFGIMATAAITNTGLTVINGDVSLDPGSSMTGVPPAVVNGAIHINDTVSAKARLDLLAAYNTAKTLPPGITISAGADLGALYPLGMAPGTYTSGSTMLVSTPLTLDGGGNANAVWIFQIGSSLTTAADVVLKNGAQAKNIFWVPTEDGTIGVNTTFNGTILSGRDVTGKTGAKLNGRILAGAITAGTIALDTNTVNVPAS